MTMMLRTSLSLLRKVSGARVCCCRQLHTSGTARMASAKLAVRDKTSKNVIMIEAFYDLSSSFFGTLASVVNVRMFDSTIEVRISQESNKVSDQFNHQPLHSLHILQCIGFFLLTAPGSRPQSRWPVKKSRLTYHQNSIRMF